MAARPVVLFSGTFMYHIRSSHHIPLFFTPPEWRNLRYWCADFHSRNPPSMRKTMFLCGTNWPKIRKWIRKTVLLPDKTYLQGDGRSVAVREFTWAVGEKVTFDSHRCLVSKHLYRVQVVYQLTASGEYRLVTSFPIP